MIALRTRDVSGGLEGLLLLKFIKAVLLFFSPDSFLDCCEFIAFVDCPSIENEVDDDDEDVEEEIEDEDIDKDIDEDEELDKDKEGDKRQVVEENDDRDADNVEVFIKRPK